MITFTIADIINVMDDIAPADLAEEWDNSGLQVGDKSWPVKSIWIALDPTLDVVYAACQDKADMLITHHPLIFKPINKINFNLPVGSVIQMAAKNRLAIFAAHTNLDSVLGGINDLLGDKIGLKNIGPFIKKEKAEHAKLVIYVPNDHEKKFLDALMRTNSGVIGEYTCCSFRGKGKGTFKPGPEAKPFTGRSGEISQVNEIRIETLVKRKNINQVLSYLKSHHPYEEMAYDLYPLMNQPDQLGIGRIGKTDKTMTLEEFALKVKKSLDLKNIRVVGNLDMEVSKVAVCTGSGSGLMKQFFSSGAHVYISGDIKYHDAKDTQASNLGLIDIGHFASEHLMVDALKGKLVRLLKEKNMSLKVKACHLEVDPFQIIS